jgi:uncharacterized membrane protein
MMTEEKQEKSFSKVGGGIVFGLIFGSLLGFIFFPENFIYGTLLGLSMGILNGAIFEMMSGQSKKIQVKAFRSEELDEVTPGYLRAPVSPFNH